MGIYISNITVEGVELAITLNLIIFYQTYMCVFSLEKLWSQTIIHVLGVVR